METKSPTPSSPLSSLASSPLSSLGRSPSPLIYPSPPSSHGSDLGNPPRRAAPADSEPTDRDEPPPAKRQKTAKSKERKTEYLNLQALHESNDEILHREQEAKLQRLLDALRTKKKIVVIAGAGISVSAGIPDFRSSTGLFKNLRTQHNLKSSGKHLFDADVYRNDSSTTSFHTMVRELSKKTQDAKPTPFHHMLATLAKEGRLLRLYTQNVDGIETSLEPLATTVPLNAKGPWPKTIQLHGGLEKVRCTKCSHLSDFDGSMFEGPEPPPCAECEHVDALRVAAGCRSHGIGRLRPRMVLYNEWNPDEDAIGNVSHADLRSRPDAVIVVGTSLKVPGIRRLAREMCGVTRDRRGGFTAWINHDPEPIGIDVKDCWDMVVRGECDDVARHVNLPSWNDQPVDFKIVKREDTDKKAEVAVVVDSKATSAFKTKGILTPTDSPRQLSPTPANANVKLKQSALSFGSGKVAPALKKDGKIKKKPGRKALPSTPTKVAEKITTAFGASKTSKPSKAPSQKAQDSKSVREINSAPSEPYFPNLVSPSTSSKAASGSQSPQTPKSSQFTVELPPFNPFETISPKGAIPSGMKDLLS